MEQTFDTPTPVQLYVENGRGRIDVTASDTTRTDIRIIGDRAEDFVVEHDGDRIAVVAPRGGGFLRKDERAVIEVSMPAASTLTVKSGSSDLVARGQLASTWVNSGSGDVDLELVEGKADLQTGSGGIRLGHLVLDGRIKSGSGDVTVGRVDGGLVISTGSGDVRVDSPLGSLAVKSGSGDVVIGESGDELACTTGSGDLRVESASRGRLTAKTASGDIGIGFTAGIPVWTDINTVSGRISSHLPHTGEPAEGQDFVEVRATTVSGDITLQQN